MKLSITIECDNAAFEDAGIGNECASILSGLARRLQGCSIPFQSPIRLTDSNGNAVGVARFIEGMLPEPMDE